MVRPTRAGCSPASNLVSDPSFVACAVHPSGTLRPAEFGPRQTSMPGNKSLYGPPHGAREPPRGTVRGDGAPCSRHTHPPHFKPHSCRVHMPSMHGSRAIHTPITCHPCVVSIDHLPSTLCSHVVYTQFTCCLIGDLRVGRFQFR